MSVNFADVLFNINRFNINTSFIRSSLLGGTAMDSSLNFKWNCVILFLSVFIIKSTAFISNGGCVTDKPNPARPVFFDTVALGDFHIRTYQWTGPSFSKFYFAPLALLDHTSASSGHNSLTGENQLLFRVDMWTDELLYIVTEYLRNVTGQTIEENRVSILPFDKVSMRCRRCSSARSDSHWRSFSQSPKQMEFRIVCPTLEECQRLAEQMNRKPGQFSSQLALYFRLDKEFSTSSIQRKSVAITSDHIWNGQIMTDLNRRFEDSNFALVVLEDRGKIVAQTLENVLADLEIDNPENVIIDPDDELRVRRMLENILFESYIIPLDEDNESAWDSLYWDHENTAWNVRPDIVARKLNKVYQNAEEYEREWILSRINQGPANKLSKKALSDETLRALVKIFQASSLQISSRLTDSQRILSWDGKHFVSKLSKLSRINLAKIRKSFKSMSNVQIKFSNIDMKFDLNLQADMTRVNFDRKPQIPQIEKNAMDSQTGEKIQQKEDISGNDPTGNTDDSGMFKGLFQTIRGAITGGGIETAPYTVLRQEKDYEERLYPTQKWVKTQAKAISKDAATSSMFWKLFNYISGQNSKQVKIPMTAPVSVYIEPGSGPNCESTFTMAFYVPAAFEEDTPEPTEEGVSLEERQEFRVFARRYGGFSKDQATQQEHKNLFDSLTEEDKQLVDQSAPYYYAGYDPPFKLFFRRNEIWMIAASEPSSQSNSDSEYTAQQTCESDKTADN